MYIKSESQYYMYVYIMYAYTSLLSDSGGVVNSLDFWPGIA